MGTHMLGQMNTNMSGLDDFAIFLSSCALDESSLSIERVNWAHLRDSHDHSVTLWTGMDVFYVTCALGSA